MKHFVFIILFLVLHILPAQTYQRWDIADLENTIQQAAVEIHKTNSEDGRYFLIKARAYQDELNRAIRHKEPLKAREYYRIAMYFARKALDTSSASEVTVEETFEQLLQNIMVLLQNMQSDPDEDPAVHELQERTRFYLANAQQLYDQNRVAQAMNQLRISERFLYRAIDIQNSRHSNQGEQINSGLYSLGRYIDAVESSLDEESSPQTLRLLNKARQFYRAAVRNRDMKRPILARRNINLAQRMASRALFNSTENPEKPYGDLSSKISELDQLLSMQKDKIAGQSSRNVINLHNMAGVFLDEARSDLENNRRYHAFQKVTMATRLINRVERLISGSETARKDITEIRNELERLNETLAKLEQQPGAEENLLAQVAILRAVHQKAMQFMMEGAYQNAQELAELIRTQLDALLDEWLH